MEVRPFEPVDEIALDPAQPVIGGLDPVVEALGTLDVTLPDIDSPRLRPFLLDPEVETHTMAGCVSLMIGFRPIRCDGASRLWLQ